MSLREHKKEKLYDALLSTAEILIKERGFQSTSMEMIATQVGISRKTIYNYFGVKEEITVQIVNRRLETWLENTRMHSTWNINATEKLVYIYRNLAMEFKREKTLWKEIVIVDGLNYLRHYSQRIIIRNLMKCLKEIFLEGQNSGLFLDKYNPEMMAWQLNSIQIRICMEWTIGLPNSRSLAKRLHDSLDLFFYGILVVI